MEVLPLFEGVSGIKVFLFNYNYIDRKIISKVKRDGVYFYQNGSIIIGADELQRILNESFAQELGFLRGFPPEGLFKNVNSIYFLDKLLSQFTNLDYVDIAVSNSGSYSRLRSQGIVTFDFKIIQIKIDLKRYQLNYIDSLLDELGYAESMNLKNYTFEATDFYERIQVYGESELFDENYEPLIQHIEAYLEDKVLTDNSILLLELT